MRRKNLVGQHARQGRHYQLADYDALIAIAAFRIRLLEFVHLGLQARDEVFHGVFALDAPQDCFEQPVFFARDNFRAHSGLELAQHLPHGTW